MELKGLRFAMHNLGCKVNSYEAEAMSEAILKEGATLVPFHEEADIYLINTCSVTNIADRKSRQMIHQAKERNPDALVIATGCYVEGKKEELKKDKGIDILIGNSGKGKIVELIIAYRNAMLENDGKIEDYLPPVKEEGEYENLFLSKPLDRSRAFVKIQDGCNQFCSYCIIPYVRGRIRSRKIEDCFTEIERLGKEGISEIVLTGIHLSSYGLDFQNLSYEYASRNTENGEALISLIEKIGEIPSIKRIRLGSLEPRVITENFVSRLKAVEEICPHFHLSLQSGAAKTLKEMNRHYTKEEFREAVDCIRRAFPLAAITTDVIVGFPGETEEDFQESKSFIEEIGFYDMHIFKYSRRKGTRADEMKDQITEKVKKERSKILLDLALKDSEKFREQFIGKTTEVLIEEIRELDGKKYYTGFNKEYIRFYIPVLKNPSIDESSSLPETASTTENISLGKEGVREKDRQGRVEIGEIYPVLTKKAMEESLLGEFLFS